MMKKEIVRKTLVLFLIFAAALIFYFIAAQNTMEKEETVYTLSLIHISEPTRP